MRRLHALVLSMICAGVAGACAVSGTASARAGDAPSLAAPAAAPAGSGGATAPKWEVENPVRPLPKVPLGVDKAFTDLAEPPAPERVRLGRWLFFDRRLSADATLSCATCHRPENAFSEPTAFSTGIRGQKGGRKAPPIINAAWTIYPQFFWDGRAASLEEQALGPIANPIEMGNTHDAMVKTLGNIKPYARYFKDCFGDERITPERVAKAIADYERTRVSGNSPWDKWQSGKDAKAVTEQVKKGHELFFFGKASCNQCHLGSNFTDSSFHNLGVGYDPAAGKFKDEGRYVVTRKDEDRGAFKTPGLRDVARHAPYMHDGSHKTLKEVVEFYNKGGEKNDHLDAKMKPLNLTPDEVDALVAFMESLNGEGYQDESPRSFPE